MEKDQLPARETTTPSILGHRSFINTHLSVTKVAVFLLVAVCLSFDRIKINVLSTFTRHDFSELAAHCAHITPIGKHEYIARQQSLAETLHSLSAAAYVAEPGPSAGYYTNISNWGLSERPFLLIIRPQIDGIIIKPNITILTPYFEKSRAELMNIPSVEPVTFLPWREEVSPYTTAMTAISSLAPAGRIFVDGELRAFIQDGLMKASPSTLVSSAPVEIQRLRQRKSVKEIEILKCANEATLLAVRAVREKMYIGMKQSEVEKLVVQAQNAAGLVDVEPLVLFGENAARPHGGGADMTLRSSDFILIDTGGALHHYYSDLTRTFTLSSTRISPRQLQVWYYVQQAQTIALTAAKNGSLAKTVDEAARSFLDSKGLGEYFTHRLGHGIGMEMHESPYLNGGSEDTILTGHTFSDEPGVYIEGEMGVRLEDSFFIDDDGNGVYLTEGVGGQASNPWQL